MNEFQFKPKQLSKSAGKSSPRRMKALNQVARCYAALVVLNTESRLLRRMFRFNTEDLEWLVDEAADAESVTADDVMRSCRRIIKVDLPKAQSTKLWFDDRLRQFCAHLDLSPAAWNVIRLGLVASQHADLNELLDHVQPPSAEATSSILSNVTGCPASDVRKALNGRGPLHTFGILAHSRAFFRGDLDDIVQIEDEIRDTLLDDTGNDDMFAQLVGNVGRSELTLQDFPHYAEELQIAEKLLRGAIQHGEPGVHILLYGPPGSGKSEIARILAQSVDARAVAVPTVDNEGDPLPDDRRFSRYATNQALARKSGKCVVVFDEAEAALEGELDGVMALFGHRSIKSRKKGTLNNWLETAAAPTIWICNSLDRFDPATLRRMTLSLQIDAPPQSIRSKLAKAELQAAVSEPLIDRIAKSQSYMPADLKRIAKAAKLTGGMMDDETAATVASARPGTPSRRTLLQPLTGHLEFRPEWINADPGVDTLLEKLKLRGRGRCGFFGPPGTGKTAFARHLAERLERRLIVKRASDLLDKYLGQTEQNIAAAFREAEREDAILLIDEVDSFLRNREGAQRSWEVTQVNELLTQIDTFGGFLIVCSNFEHQLDPALARRLHLKAKFSPMTAEHLSEAVRCAAHAVGITAVKVAAADEIAKQFAGLTPGDLEAAIESVLMTTTQPDWAALTKALKDELRYKPQHAKAIGFV